MMGTGMFTDPAGQTWEELHPKDVRQRDEYLWALYYDQQKGKLDAGEDSMFEYIHTPGEKDQVGWLNRPDMPPIPPIPEEWDRENPFDKKDWYHTPLNPPSPRGMRPNPNLPQPGPPRRPSRPGAPLPQAPMPGDLPYPIPPVPPRRPPPTKPIDPRYPVPGPGPGEYPQPMKKTTRKASKPKPRKRGY